MVKIKVKKLYPDAIIPTRATQNAACFDLYAYRDAMIRSNIVTLVPCGIAVEIPKGYFIDARPRSGLSKVLSITNAPGTIDSDYRGQIFVQMIMNNTAEASAYKIMKGERIAQIRVEKVWDTEFIEVDELSDTERGTGGFGSTGK